MKIRILYSLVSLSLILGGGLGIKHFQQPKSLPASVAPSPSASTGATLLTVGTPTPHQVSPTPTSTPITAPPTATAHAEIKAVHTPQASSEPATQPTALPTAVVISPSPTPTPSPQPTLSPTPTAVPTIDPAVLACKQQTSDWQKQLSSLKQQTYQLQQQYYAIPAQVIEQLKGTNTSESQLEAIIRSKQAALSTQINQLQNQYDFLASQPPC